MTLKTIGAKAGGSLLDDFETKRKRLGLTKSDALREALRLFNENEP